MEEGEGVDAAFQTRHRKLCKMYKDTFPVLCATVKFTDMYFRDEEEDEEYTTGAAPFSMGVAFSVASVVEGKRVEFVYDYSTSDHEQAGNSYLSFALGVEEEKSKPTKDEEKKEESKEKEEKKETPTAPKDVIEEAWEVMESLRNPTTEETENTRNEEKQTKEKEKEKEKKWITLLEGESQVRLNEQGLKTLCQWLGINRSDFDTIKKLMNFLTDACDTSAVGGFNATITQDWWALINDVGETDNLQVENSEEGLNDDGDRLWEEDGNPDFDESQMTQEYPEGEEEEEESEGEDEEEEKNSSDEDEDEKDEGAVKRVVGKKWQRKLLARNRRAKKRNK